MKHTRNKNYGKIKESLFPPSMFAIYLGVLFFDVRHSYGIDCINEFRRLE